MKRIVLTLALICFLSAASPARWMLIQTEELVQDSDSIVVGTLDNVSEYAKNGIDFAQGTITVEEVIWGAARSGDVLTLKRSSPVKKIGANHCRVPAGSHSCDRFARAFSRLRTIKGIMLS